MAGDAHRTTVGDYVTLVRGTTYKGALVGDPGPALLGLGSIEPGGGFRIGHYKTYGGDCPDELMLFPGDIYASLKGATKDGKMIGSVARVPPSVPTGRLTQDTVKLVFRDRDPVAETYLYWVLRAPQYRDYCAGHAMGSAVVALSRRDFLSYSVPPLTPLREMVTVLLDSIEERIELNRSMSETLEAMVRALFKSWFVDFEPVRAKAEGRDPGLPRPLADLFPDSVEDSELGEIPSGWTVRTLGSVAEHQRRGIQADEIEPSTPYFALEHMPKRSVALSDWGVADGIESNKFEFKRGEILFGKLRPYFHKVGVAPTDGVCSTDIVVVVPRAPEWFGYVLATVSSDTFVAHTNAGSTGTKMPRTSWGEMSRYPVVLPTADIAGLFTAQVRTTIDRVIESIHESRTLVALRDALLPKLVSGELRVNDAEKFIERVVDGERA